MVNLKPKPLFPALALALCLCAYLLYTFLLACSLRCNSDMANMVLEANDIIHGNFFLKDWILTGISFFTTDLLFFELGTLLFGVSNLAYVFALWLMWLSVVGAGSLLFLDSCTKNKRRWIGFLFLCLSAFSVPAMAFSRVHAASAAFALMGIFFARRAARSGRRGAFVLSALFLVLATAGDISGLLTAVLPVALVYSVKSFRAVAYEGGRARNRQSAVAVMAVCSLLVALALERLWLAIGGADKNSYIGEKLFLQVREWPGHVGVYLDGLFALLDARFMGEPLSGPYALVKLCRSLAVLAGFCIMGRNVWRFFRGRDCDETIVLLGLSFFAISLAYVVTPLSIDIATTRYFAYAPVPFALAISCHVAFVSPAGMDASVRRALKAALAACSLLFIFASVKHNRVTPRILFDGELRRQVCYDVARLELAEFLEGQGLTSGYAAFWNASIISVYTGGRVRVRQINPDGSQYRWFCKNSWYGEYADFIVTNQLDREKLKLNFSDGGGTSL